MADRMTTLRSDYYKRPYPYTGANPTNPAETGQRLGKWYDDYLNAYKERKARKEQEKSKRTQHREALVSTNPWLEPLLQKVALARLNLLNTDDGWAKDKSYGWGHKLNFKEAPQDSEFFTLNQDPVTGEIWVEDTDEALKFFKNPTTTVERDGKFVDPQQAYKELRAPFEDYAREPFTQAFEPMTEKEAKAGGYDWYPTTNEVLNALIETQLGEGNKEALYDAAQYYLSEMLRDDRAKDTREFENADRKLLLSDGSTKPSFEAPNGVAEFGKNMVIPFTNAVMADPELWYKTGRGEVAGRAVTDALLNGASIALPWIGGARGAAMASRPAIGAVIGGAAGGNANYWLKRLANQGWDMGSGHGGIEHPIDLFDMAIETGAGALGGLGANANRVGGYRALKAKMKPADPTSVPTKDVNTSIKLAKQYGDKANAEPHFRSEAFAQYGKDYPNAAKQVRMFPKLEAEASDDLGTRVIPLAQDLPNGSAVRTGRVAGSGANANKYIDTRIKTTNPVTGKPYEVVNEWINGTDPEFLAAYRGRNAKFFDNLLREGDLKDIGKAAKKAQAVGAPEKEYFTGGLRTFSDKDYAAKLAALSGENFDDETKIANKAIAHLLRNDVKIGNKVKGKFTKADPKQQKAYDKSMNTYKNRTNMKLVDATDKKNAFKNDFKTGMLKTPVILNSGVSNALPWGSNKIFDVPPYLYVAPTDEE